MAPGDERGGLEGNGDSPVEMEAPLQDVGSPTTRMGINPKVVDEVMYSEIGINVLLNKLKQSIASVRDFAGFLKKRSALEEEHAQGLKKLAKSTYDAARRHDGRQGSYALQLGDVSRAHERMADNGIQFALSLQQMQEDLTELSNNMERGRKHWKQEGGNSEKKVKDAESLMEKAKTRYDSLAEDYDRARTGEHSGRVFTVKGPKSAEKHEEDLLRKLQAADQDYKSKVEGAQLARQENLITSRPIAIRAIQEFIRESDSGLTLQMQKYAAFNEKLLVGNGLVVSPVRDANGEETSSSTPSMREMISQIDNERDFQIFVTSHSNTVPPKPTEIRYEKHPLLGPTPQQPQTVTRDTAPVVEKPLPTPQARPPQPQPQPQTQTQIQPPVPQQQRQIAAQAPVAAPLPPVQSQMRSTQSSQNTSPISPNVSYGYQQQGRQQALPNRNFRGPPTQQHQPYPSAPPVGTNGTFISSSASVGSRQPPVQQYGSPPTNGSYAQRDAPREIAAPAPPTKPLFGVGLDQLFRRDETAVPMVVYQCVQAVDLFGLDVEGIYRLSGNAAHINQLKTLFDNGSSRVDFRNPENFHHDVNSVAGLLKQFLRDLPDPLMTTEYYNDFVDAARIEDDIVRRDALHGVINNLPDPNYATLRALILHLNRVQEHSQANRMSTSNLAICFAPTIMGQHNSPHMADAGLQARVIDTILQNTYQIFDED